jgi:hypothetical protein
MQIAKARGFVFALVYVVFKKGFFMFEIVRVEKSLEFDAFQFTNSLQLNNLYKIKKIHLFILIWLRWLAHNARYVCQIHNFLLETS